MTAAPEPSTPSTVAAGRAAVAELDTRNAWRDNVPFVLMMAVTAGLFGMLAVMAFHEVPTANKDLVNVVLGAVAGGWVTGVGFFWGSSSSSKTKDATIASLASTSERVAP